MHTLVANNKIYFESESYVGYYDGLHYFLTNGSVQFKLRYDEDWDAEFDRIKQACWEAACKHAGVDK